MPDLFTSLRSQPQALEMRYRFEKAGLTLEGQPIPWNAEAVVVEARVHLPMTGMSRLPQDFSLRISSQRAPVATEEVYPCDRPGEALVSFRFPVPDQSTLGEVFYRSRSLGQLALPVLNARDFLRRVTLQMPTASVRLGEASVACQSFVASQCQGLIVSGVVQTSGQPPCSLAPLVDMNLRVQISREHGEQATSVPIHLSGSQLKTHQALVSAALPKPRGVAGWRISWLLDGNVLASQRLRAIAKPLFHRSLHVVGTRYVVQDAAAQLRMVMRLPDHGFVRAGPCFLLASSEPGMAGILPVRTVVRLKAGLQSPVLGNEDVLITDGPCPILPGTLERADLEQVHSFELVGPRGVLARLPLEAVPTATFNNEGGFKTPEDFEWTLAAEEEWQDKLSKMLGK